LEGIVSCAKELAKPPDIGEKGLASDEGGSEGKEPAEGKDEDGDTI